MMHLWIYCITFVITSSGSQAQQPFPFFPGYHFQGWPTMPAYVPQAQPQPPMWGPPAAGPRPGAFPGMPRPVPRPMPGQPNPNPDVDEPETRNHPNPGPSGPEHESEADIIPARPDDGSGGGPTSATPGRPLIANPYGRLAGALVQPVQAIAVSTSNGQSNVPVVSYVTNVVPRLIPGAIAASPLIPAGHSIVYYDEVSHGGSPQAKELPDQKPDESQRHELVLPADDTQQQQQTPEAPVVPVPAAAPVPVPAPAPIPVAPAVQTPAVVEPAFEPESTGEDQGASESGSSDEENGPSSGNDQPAVGVSDDAPAAAAEEGSDEEEKPIPQEMRRRINLPESKINQIPQQQQTQTEDVPQEPVVVPVAVPQQEVKGVKRRVPRPPAYPVKGQQPLAPPPAPVNPGRKIPEQAVRGQVPDVEAPFVPQQAVKGGVKGGRQQEVKGQRPAAQIPEQSIKGQAPVVPAVVQPEVIAPPPAPKSVKGGRRRLQVLPQTPVVEEEVLVPQAPQQAVKGGVKGSQQQQEVKGYRYPPPPAPAAKRPAPPTGVKGGPQQQLDQVPEQQEQAVKV